MTSKELFQEFGMISPEMVLAAAPKVPRKRVPLAKWVSLAACLCLVVSLAVSLPVLLKDTSRDREKAVTFTWNGAEYTLIRLEDYIAYGLVEEGTTVLTTENFYYIQKSDLGDVMGSVVLPSNEGETACTLYHFASFPEDDGICIIEFSSGEWCFYIRQESEG